MPYITKTPKNKISRPQPQPHTSNSLPVHPARETPLSSQHPPPTTQIPRKPLRKPHPLTSREILQRTQHGRCEPKDLELRRELIQRCAGPKFPRREDVVYRHMHELEFVAEQVLPRKKAGRVWKGDGAGF